MDIAVTHKGLTAFFSSHDTYGIIKSRALSIPLVSDSPGIGAYAFLVPVKTALGWGARFRQQLKANGLTLANVAEKLGRSEPAVRSWTNGHREINLSEFLELCAAAHVDPAFVLFAEKVDKNFLVIGEAWGKANIVQREALIMAAHGIIAQDDAQQRARTAAGAGQGDPRRTAPNRRL